MFRSGKVMLISRFSAPKHNDLSVPISRNHQRLGQPSGRLGGGFIAEYPDSNLELLTIKPLFARLAAERCWLLLFNI